ncbi:MAG TPA: anhydro-N-acetylmuramic acid kinase [Bryocella sp.]|nr:anhydro-N-acetylmuramic acid kinase [Bryocella sp.]
MIARKPKAMIVAGVMSGTSADGVDVAICHVSPGAERVPRVKVLEHYAMVYPAKLRATVLAAMDAKNTSTAELARLNWRLGEVYAEAVSTAARKAAVKPQLIACHGQTIYHQASATKYLGAPVRCTWQSGEAAVIAERMRVPVVSDFRAADMAAGGQAAPLVPMFDFCVFRDARRSRVLLNLGGIANVTVLPAECRANDVVAFDTGPANMVIDACMERLFGRGFDRNGEIAARGRELESVVTKLLRTRYFPTPPPKSCGREEYGDVFVNQFIAACERKSNQREDVIATATALTARTIADAYVRFCKPQLERLAPTSKVELIAAGGGVRNASLMRMLDESLRPLRVRVRSIEETGLNPGAKEAAAFALLGWLTWHGLPGNLPSATGAKRPVVLGKVTLA